MTQSTALNCSLEHSGPHRALDNSRIKPPHYAMQKNDCEPLPSRLQAARMMTRLLIAGAAAMLFSACATTHHEPKGIHTASKPVGKMHVRTTAYTHTEPGGNKNGVGGRLRFKSPVRSAAADWSWLPLGTRFRMMDSPQEYVIEDYGSALVGRQTIDLYMPTRQMMNAWGVRFVDIDILEWGSKIMSLKLLEGRQRRKHVRTMVAQLRSQGVKVGVKVASTGSGRSM
jgi:3D (Asp-Asp-Asp) domain-containing protein